MPRYQKRKNPPAKTDISATGNMTVITSSTCKVCQSPNRHYIDILLARGFSTRAIEKQLKDSGEDISYKSINRHSQNHLNIDTGLFRRLAEQHVEEVKEEVAKGSFRIISGKSFLDLFIQKGWDNLLFGDMIIEGRDVMQAIKLRSDLEKDSTHALEEEMGRQLNAIIIAIQEIVPEELQPAIAQRAKEIARGEVLKQLEPPIMEAEEIRAQIQEVEFKEGGDEEDGDRIVRRGATESSEDYGDDQSEVYDPADYWPDSESDDE